MKRFFPLVILFCFGQVFAQNKTIDRLREELPTAAEDTSKIHLLNTISHNYTWLSADTAALYAQQAIQLSQKLNFLSGKAWGMTYLSIAYTVLGNFSGALDFGYKSQALFQELKDTAGLIESLSNLSMCYRQQGEYKEAKQNLQEVIRLNELKHLDIGKTGAAAILGSIYEKNNQLDSALFYAQQTYTSFKDWSGLLNVLGAIHAKWGHNELALDFYRRAIPLAIDSNFQVDVLDAYNGMAHVYVNEGNTDSAVFYAKQALTDPGARTYPVGMLNASTLLAHIYKTKNNTDSTLKYLNLTVNLKDSLFNQQKTRLAQSFTFNNQLHQQELAAQKQQDASTLKMYLLIGIALIILTITFFLYRNNRHKQKAYALLQKQKQEIDTQKLKAENALEELKTTQSQLIQSEKMASLGELTAGIAHEIQNPLNFINNFSEVNQEILAELHQEIEKGNFMEVKALARDVIGNEEKINHHGRRADAIVKSMLQHSRSSTGLKEPTDINALADEYLRLSYHGLRAKDKFFNATMHTDFDDSMAPINIIPQDIGRVLLNLFNNAFFAVAEKKRKLPEQAAYIPTVSVSTKKTGKVVEIRVCDNGMGIPQEIINKIFHPFFTTKAAGQGTGLGLSLSYDIIKAHGGTIQVETKEGECTEFVIHLPITS